MNAPQERGQESYKKVQLVVLMEEICDGTADEKTFAMLRAVSEHLPEEARALWIEVESISERLDEKDYDTSILTESEKSKIQLLKETLRNSIVELSNFIETFIGFLDPETVTEFTTALAEKDVDRVNSILDSCADAKERRETRVEE